MISKEDIKKLAQLARLQVSEKELSSMEGELSAILDFVSQVKQIPDSSTNTPEVLNVMREDQVTNVSGEYTDALLAAAPKSEDGFIKVKKILSND